MTPPDERDERDDAEEAPSRDRRPRTGAEWTVFGVSVALLGAVLAVILVAWATGPTGPPVLVAERSGPVTQEGDVYRVPWSVRNDGGEAANDVQVVAELVVDGRVEAEGEQTVMFLSSGEEESGAFLMATNPVEGTLTISVASYSEP